MSKLRIITCAALACTVLVTPVLAQQKRKTLLQVLFPKAHERKVKREQLKQDLFEQSKPKKAAKAAKAAKVPKTVYYTYKVAKRAPIKLVPLAVEYAFVGSISSSDHPTLNDGSQSPEKPAEPSAMTKDLLLAERQAMSAEAYLAKTVSDYYSQNQGYVWLNEEGEWNARARSVIAFLEAAEEFGLRGEDYAVNALPVSADVADEDQDKKSAGYRIRREVSMSVAVLRYAMDAKFGTINPNRLSGYHDFPVHHTKASAVFEDIFGTGLPVRNLASMHPTNDKFMALKRELASISQTEDDVIDLPAKVLIRPGMKHEAFPKFVAAIRKRASHELLQAHSDFLAAYTDDEVYTKEAVTFVRDYQKEAGLGPDGVIGPNTSRKLAGLAAGQRIDQVTLAMERLRWLPHELGSRHVFINQPEYRARYMENGAEKLSMRIVVGKKSNQTNFFYDKIEHVVYNPYWGVPRSIIVNEFAAKSISNPGYLDQRGYEVSTFGGKKISSSSIDWSSVGVHPKFAVRQPPGAKNALGKLKIMFPNKHSIYMHDTPAKHLFSRSSRAYSHGCVRLHNPQAMAAAVLGRSKGHINSMISRGKNQTEKLRSKVPVYVSYFTAWPQKNGSVKYFSDMYGRDNHLMKAIKATQKARSVSISS